MTFLPSMENSGTCRRHRGSAHSGSHPAAAAPVRVRPPGAGQPGGLRAAGGRGPQGFCPEEPLSSRPEPEQVPPRAFSSPREGAGRLSCNKQWPPGPTPNSALLIPHPGDRQTMPVPASPPDPTHPLSKCHREPVPRARKRRAAGPGGRRASEREVRGGHCSARHASWRRPSGTPSAGASDPKYWWPVLRSGRKPDIWDEGVYRAPLASLSPLRILGGRSLSS